MPATDPSAAAPDEPHVALSGVRMAYGEREVFGALSCAFPRGRISVILGGSGSGKSTILRLIGGLVCPQAGRIVVGGEDVTRLSERQLYRVRKQLGMMFQGGALLDSMTVFDNLAFPLREHTRMREPEIAAAVHERLESVGLSRVDDLLPNQLSGGMMRRVALARAIMMKPVILLCDEPFSGLDPPSVALIEALLRDINRRLGSTVIVVSHHIASTMRFGEHVVLLLPQGQVEGSPAELQASADPRVAAFLNEDGAAVPETARPAPARRHG
jgi:phospholipid/cholesterol/gamma-HCH transport system ATP-binding protein